MEFHYSDLCMPTDHLMPEFPQPTFLVKKEAEYDLRAGVVVDGGDQFGVSSVIFDKYEELIWMGNQGGHVTSYYGPSLQKYTSFQIHVSEEVRDILTLEEGIYCLTKTSLRHQIRRGIPRHTHKSPNMEDMQCLFQLDTHKVLMGGHQDKLLELDLNKWVESVINVPEEGCAVLRSGGGSVVACGSASGLVTLRDLRCPGSVEQSFQAHTACLSDLDMQGDMLITCGFTQSSSSAVAEPYVVVWDVRCVRDEAGAALRHIPTASPPQLLHFVPAVSGRAVAVASDGHVTVLDVNDALKPDSQSVFQVETHNSQCSVMDVSATSQALVFGDLGGHIHMFSAKQNHEPTYNSFPRETEFADPPPELPYSRFDDKNFRFSSIPRPPLTTGARRFSELPADCFKKTYRKPKPIDPEILKTMKMQGPIGYAPNPRTFRRNQMPYVDENLDDLTASQINDARVQPIPRYYLRIEFRFNTPSSNDDVDVQNKTGFPGLEWSLPNSYCNAMLQVLYYIPPLKAAILSHTCAKEFCLSCELGFLFRTLDTSGGAPVQATNFLRAFRTVPEAAALGLILPDRWADMNPDLVTLIQSWNRFMLHQIHSEILETRRREKQLTLITQNSSPPKPVNGQYDEYQNTDVKYMGPPVCEVDSQELLEEECVNNHVEGPVETVQVQPETNGPPDHVSRSEDEESEISQLFAIGRQQVNRCTKCNKEEERESVVMACALQYVAHAEGETGGFLELVRASLSSRRSTPAWCEHCARFTPTLQRGRINRLPPILAINCGGVTAQEKTYWTKGVQKDMPETTKRGGTSKPCRYGLQCARPGCRFKHPERPSSAPQINSIKNSTEESNCVLPHQLHIRLQADGDVIIDDKTDIPPTEPRIDFNRPKKKSPDVKHEEQYTLSSVVLCVEDSPRNLVAYVRIPDKDDDARWFLFNDLNIVPVSPDEVVQFSSWWKSPCVLFYTNARAMQAAGDDS